MEIKYSFSVGVVADGSRAGPKKARVNVIATVDGSRAIGRDEREFVFDKPVSFEELHEMADVARLDLLSALETALNELSELNLCTPTGTLRDALDGAIMSHSGELGDF